ncbi:Arginase/deacetylase [Microthyrium microscopicum]|uniref:Arginase/deacetylase n=1 Tax=Microthyrium microscopicum TaxID=703497 RepID=A0A6A6U0K6_9PEZI|nr:Arginase/deacetylase [Microthyrium microscopicum]
MGTRTINIINVPSDLGSVYAGKSKAPSAFKSVGIHKKLATVGFHLTEYTAFSTGGWQSSTREPNGARNEANTVEACNKVRQTVAAALAEQHENNKNRLSTFQLVFAGECLYCPAIMSAYWDHVKGSDKRIGIIYIDADCDLYTPKESNSSGNIAGMTLTHLTLREGALDSMKRFCRPGSKSTGVVDNGNIILFGLNIDSPANKREHLGYLFNNNFNVITSQAVQKAPQLRAKEALKWMEDRVDYILVHLDVDVIDPGLFPLGNVPNWTGLGFKETMSAMKIFLKSKKTVGLSVAEVNPDHDPELKMTSQLVEEIVSGMLGRISS